MKNIFEETDMQKGLLDSLYGKTILLTGHTGFKGSWMAIWLSSLGTNVAGYSLDNDNSDSNFVRSGIKKRIQHTIGDIRNEESLRSVFSLVRPDAVVHMAAQSIVRHSLKYPKYTYDVNVMGTLNVLERFRECETCRAALIITSDKCYENNEWVWGYRENDRIGGADIYSSSKGCAELLVSSYRRSFLDDKDYTKHGKLLITARAGNVIGGGDWNDHRIVPDCIRALSSGSKIMVRNPEATRPWQHVLDPLFGYLLLLENALEGDVSCSGAWNFGPDFSSVITVDQLVKKIIAAWSGDDSTCTTLPSQDLLSEITIKNPASMPESGCLNLDACKAKRYLEWFPVWDIGATVQKTVEWYRNYKDTDVYSMCLNQIGDYCSKIKTHD